MCYNKNAKSTKLVVTPAMLKIIQPNSVRATSLRFEVRHFHDEMWKKHTTLLPETGGVPGSWNSENITYSRREEVTTTKGVKMVRKWLDGQFWRRCVRRAMAYLVVFSDVLSQSRYCHHPCVCVCVSVSVCPSVFKITHERADGCRPNLVVMAKRLPSRSG